MRTLAALLLALAACGSDDTGDGSGPDGGGDPFVGEYTATWSPDAPWPIVTIRLSAGGENHVLSLWEGEPREPWCMGEGDCRLMGGFADGSCLLDVDGTGSTLCLSTDRATLSGTGIQLQNFERYDVTLTRR